MIGILVGLGVFCTGMAIGHRPAGYVVVGIGFGFFLASALNELFKEGES